MWRESRVSWTSYDCLHAPASPAEEFATAQEGAVALNVLEALDIAYFVAITMAFFALPVRRWTVGPYTLGLLCVIVRLLPAIVFPYAATYDITSYNLVANAVLGGRDVYTAAELVSRDQGGSYPYLPGWDVVVAVAKLASANDQMLFTKFVKIPGILADAAIVLFLHHFAGPQMALNHVLSPISILVTAYHGQFDALPLLTVVAASTMSYPTTSGVMLGLGIWIKTWPAVFIITVFHRFGLRSGMKAAVMALTVAAVCAGAVGMITHASVAEVFARVAGYNSTTDWRPVGLLRGYGERLGMRSVAPLMDSWKWFAALGTVIGYTFLARRGETERATLGLVLLLLVLLPGGSIQYVSWIGPVALLAKQSDWFRRWTLLTLPYLVAAYFGVLVLQVLPVRDFVWRSLSLPSWAMLVLWLRTLFRTSTVATVPDYSPSGAG
ncbi:MAG: glycosyltransferase 87 family protein [Chloroflexota bacterium]|nr:glycosyltransferase 87 family protein [Chloroflexota bacterium]